jgi:translation elongation factor EF-G
MFHRVLQASSGDILISNKKVDQLEQLSQLKEQYRFLPDPGLQAPTPVFFCTIETYSERTQKDLDNALQQLKREDPSLRVRTDEQTGQLILLGMGELHIDIIHDRLKQEYGLETYLGPLNVNYRETIRQVSRQTITWNSHINGKHATISITFTIEPLTNVNDNRIQSFTDIQIVRTDDEQFEYLRKEQIGNDRI